MKPLKFSIGTWKFIIIKLLKPTQTTGFKKAKSLVLTLVSISFYIISWHITVFFTYSDFLESIIFAELHTELHWFLRLV